MWLPHGLAKGTSPAALLPLLSLCRFDPPTSANCEPVEVASVKLLNKGTLLASVPDLQYGRQQYRLVVRASSALRDGYGLPLQASQTTFWTPNLSSDYAGPSAANNVVIVEPSTSDLEWPLVSRGATNNVTTAAAYDVSTSSEADMGNAFYMISVYQGFNAGERFGRPSVSATRPRTTDPAFTALELSGASGLQAVATCCT